MQVSVIIPTYNSARFLAEAIDSVLAQSFTDFEILVIDDGSTDETESLMSRYRSPVRYIRQANAGVAAARNRGIKESRGRYVAFLDADDTWYARKLEIQLAALNEETDIRACYSAYAEVDLDLKPTGIHRSERHASALEDLLLRGNVIGSICTVVCERSLFASTGGFDPILSQCADWDIWVRLASLTEFLYIDEPLVTYRQHGSNMSLNAALLERDSLRVLEKGFEMPGIPDSLRPQRGVALARNYMVLSGTYFHSRHFADSFRCAVKAVTLDLGQMTYLLAYPARLMSRLFQNKRAEIT